MPKEPQDHKKKATAEPLSSYDRIRAEVGSRDWGPLEPLRGGEIKVKGRHGVATVTILDNMADWDDDYAIHLHREDYGAFLRCVVSNADLLTINAVKPSVAATAAALMDALEAVEPGGVDLGEESASQAS